MMFKAAFYGFPEYNSTSWKGFSTPLVHLAIWKVLEHQNVREVEETNAVRKREFDWKHYVVQYDDDDDDDDDNDSTRWGQRPRLLKSQRSPCLLMTLINMLEIDVDLITQ